MVSVYLNGQEMLVGAGSTVADLVASVLPGAQPARGLAVACNREVVPRSSWPAVVVCSGDRFELLAPAQGG